MKNKNKNKIIKQDLIDWFEIMKIKINEGWCKGLCSANYVTRHSYSLTDRKAEKIREVVNYMIQAHIRSLANKKRFNRSGFYWNPFDKRPRIEILDLLIKKLKELP